MFKIKTRERKYRWRQILVMSGILFHWRMLDHDLLRNNEFQDFIIDRAKKLLCAIEQATGRKISGKDSDEVKKAFGDSLM